MKVRKPPSETLYSIYFPVLYPAGMARRLLRENPNWPESIPFAMVETRAERLRELFGYGPILLARSGGLTPQGLVALLDDIPTEEAYGISLAEAVAIVLIHVADHEAERAATEASTDDEDPSA